jgi:NAD(P)-dependent dehydrogenase (short-subunit alcohol dehydrogenase family)
MSTLETTVLSSTLSLSDKSAIITGATRGIGVALASELAHRGANIAIVYTSDKSTPAANQLVQQIQALGRKACAIQVNLEDDDCGERIVKAALSGLGVSTIEILVNNAAVGVPPRMSEEGYDSATFAKWVLDSFPIYPNLFYYHFTNAYYSIFILGF